MFSYIIGNLDWPSAAALIAMFLGIGSIGVIIIGKHKSKDEIDIEKMHLTNKHLEETYKLETWRGAEMKKIEQSLLSHKEV